jgi:hypothetical protein
LDKVIEIVGRQLGLRKKVIEIVVKAVSLGAAAKECYGPSPFQSQICFVFNIN